MIDLRFRPIVQWQGVQTPSYNRKRATFRCTYTKTLDLLEAELSHLKAKDIVVQTFMPLEQIRNDGWPKANARPSHPGVILSFVSRTGPLSFPCDRYDKWEDNLRGIALSLEALRAVDRYGVTKGNEQYKGWTALPAADDGKMGSMEAADFISRHCAYTPDQIHYQKATAEDAYKQAAKACHPDTGGSHELFVKLQEAKAALGF